MGPPHPIDREYDVTSPNPMKHLYMIASTPRSCGNFLSRLLWETRFLGRPAEYFNFNKPVLVLSARFGTDTMDAY